jgi:hypothetical protein
VGIEAGIPFAPLTSSPVFWVTGAGTNVALSGLTITDGFGGQVGGAIANTNFSTLTVSGCTVSNSFAAEGGGIYNNAATLKLVNSTLSGNLAQDSNGFGVGGGLYSNGSNPVSMTDCTLSDNTAAEGSDVWLYSTTMTINGCLFTGDVGARYYTGNGEDIYNGTPAPPKKVNHNSSYPVLTVSDSVFTNNTLYYVPIEGPWIDGGGNTNNNTPYLG